MKLLEYVDLYYAGNKAAFARAFDREPQGVSKMFRNPENWRIIIENDYHIIVQIRAVMTP